MSYNHIGARLAESGDPSGALAAFEQALTIRRKLADDNPTITDLRTDLAWSYNNSGIMLTRIGDRAKAMGLHEQARAIRQKLIHDNPTVVPFQSDLATSHANIGSLHQRAGQFAEAKASFEQVIAVLDPLPALSPVDLYGLTCAHSLLSGLARESGSGITPAEGQVHAERAMESFKRAIAAGYRDIANIRTDSDLEPIRARPDFGVLMMDLTFPGNPFTR